MPSPKALHDSQCDTNFVRVVVSYTAQEALDTAQEAIESELDEKDLEPDIVGAAGIRDEARKVRVQAMKVLADAEAQPCHVHDADLSVTPSVAFPMKKLPKIQLAKFNGDVMNWQSWWQPFDVSIHQSNLPAVSKFSYLQSLLVGDAKKAIEGLSL